ncbi:hypothetical protein I4F81_012390 [Pyropia yezoensis]|uniref:Uncharacterized protein n=1 Tax=Pyropia yezoensis TaxID=2788 RepID=A0ACC3CI83_PYRYE|nr:hypothetical protein I4F81_012390 [Neopyropia yezoensis]
MAPPPPRLWVGPHTQRAADEEEEDHHHLRPWKHLHHQEEHAQRPAQLSSTCASTSTDGTYNTSRRRGRTGQKTVRPAHIRTRSAQLLRKMKITTTGVHGSTSTNRRSTPNTPPSCRPLGTQWAPTAPTTPTAAASMRAHRSCATTGTNQHQSHLPHQPPPQPLVPTDRAAQ